MFYLSHQCHICLVFSILDSILKFSGKKSTLLTFSFLWNWYRSGSSKMMRIRPDPDPDPQNWSRLLVNLEQVLGFWSQRLKYFGTNLQLKRKNEIFSTVISSVASTSDFQAPWEVFLLFKRGHFFWGGGGGWPFLLSSSITKPLTISNRIRSTALH